MLKLFLDNSLYVLIILILSYLNFHAPIYDGNYTFPILFIFLSIYSLLNFRKLVMFLQCFKKELTFILFFIFYCSLRALLGGDSSFISMWVRTFFEFFLFSFVIIDILRKIGVSSLDGLNATLIMLGSVGAIISTACIVNPAFNMIVKAHFSVYNDSYLSELTYRCFGISDSLTYSYGIIQGIILLLCIIYIKKFKWSLFMIPFIILSILLNARTGIIVFGSSLLLFYILSKRFSNLITVILVGILITAIVMQLLRSYIDSDGLIWIENFFIDIQNSFSQKNESTFGTLLGDMAVWPSNVTEWFFGKGFSIYRNAKQTSDVGFFRQLNYGGLFYVIPLYYFVLLMYNVTKRNGYYIHAVLFLLIFFIANLKGDFIPYSGGFRLIMLYYCFLKFFKPSTLR